MYFSENFTHDVNNIEILFNNKILNVIKMYALEDSLSIYSICSSIGLGKSIRM